jgi:hypothetical protein
MQRQHVEQEENKMVFVQWKTRFHLQNSRERFTQTSYLGYHFHTLSFQSRVLLDLINITSTKKHDRQT